MAKSPLEDAVAKWGQRAQQAQRAGIPFDKIKSIAKYDIEKVQRGGTGLNDMAANLAILSSASGKSILGDPHPKHTSPLGILGRVAPDISNIIMGFGPGLIKTAWHLPSETHDVYNLLEHGQDPKWLAAHGYDPKGAGFPTPEHLAANLRNITQGGAGGKRMSLESLIPGVWTAAKLTTGKGREELRQHPVGAVLDVLPLAQSASKAAAAGKVAEEGSAVESLQRGKPAQALARTIPAGRDAGKVISLAERTRNVVQKIGMDPETAQKLVRPYSITTRKLHSDVMKFWKGAVEPIVGKLSPEESAQLMDEATNYHLYGQMQPDGTIKAISPEHHALIQNVRLVQDMMADVGQSRGSLLRIPGEDGRSHVYSVDSPVSKQFTRVNKAADKILTETDPIKLAKAQQKLVLEQRKLVKTMRRTPPAAFHSAVEAKVRTGAEEMARSKYQGESLTTALRDIRESTSWQDFEKIVGEKEFHSLVQDSTSSWVEMSKMGLDPVWMHHVPESKFARVLYPKPLPDQYVKPQVFRDKTFNFSPHMHNIAVAMTDAGAEVLRADATRHFVDRVVTPLTRKAGDVKSELRNSLREVHANPDELAAAVEREIDKRFNRFDPANPFSGTKARTGHDEDMLLAKHVDQAIDGLMGAQRRLPIKGAWDKSLNVFKFSVLTGPRHVVHVGVGGLMFSMLREPGMLRRIPEAVRVVRSGEMPVELPQSLYGLESDQIFNIAAGKSMAKHLITSVGSKARALAHFEEFVSNVERTATYLSAAKRGLDHEAALNIAHKTFVDLDNLMPVERYLVKQVFPFYAFTRHLFRYLLTYPVDHPLRAGILAKFAEHEIQEWNTGLPLKYQHLFFLGGGDVKTAVDFKSINPFRSFGNDFTLAGFAQSLNPLATAALTSMGVNSVTAVPELYPNVEYDPTSGTLQAKRKNFALSALQSYIPETQALDAVIGVSDRMRRLRETNPDAYRRTLFSNLNLPFAFGDVSLSQIRAKAEVARYEAASRAVSKGQSSGNFGTAEQFKAVPFRGQLVDPTALASVWSELQAALGNVNPKAVVPPYRGRRKR